MLQIYQAYNFGIYFLDSYNYGVIFFILMEHRLGVKIEKKNPKFEQKVNV
jgi:hypothetical protein